MGRDIGLFPYAFIQIGNKSSELCQLSCLKPEGGIKENHYNVNGFHRYIQKQYLNKTIFCGRRFSTNSYANLIFGILNHFHTGHMVLQFFEIVPMELKPFAKTLSFCDINTIPSFTYFRMQVKNQSIPAPVENSSLHTEN